jgi:hypothetical protein
MALSQGAIKRNRKANKEAKLKKYREAKNKNKVKKPMPFGLMGITKKMGGKVTKRPMGGKVYKVNNSGQQMVAKQYGGKVK